MSEPAVQDRTEGFSIFAKKFNIPTVASNLTLWDKEWEKVLPKLSASNDVYAVMSLAWNRKELEAVISGEDTGAKARQLQEVAMDLWDKMEESSGHFLPAWVLLEERERKRHLLHGLKDACKSAFWGADSRALCPEIATGSMLKQRGRAFYDFVDSYVKGIKDVGAGNLYLLPSDWWRQAVETTEPLSEDVKFAFAQLTIQRTEFIGECC